MAKTYKNINIFVSFLGVMIIGWFSVFKPNLILLYSVFTSLFGYFMLTVLITPAGGITLGERSQRLSYFDWLGRIVSANFIIIILTFAAAYAFLGNGPEITQGALSYHFTKEIVSEYSLTHWGIFPWGIYGIWGMCIAYYAYVKKGAPFLYQSGNFLPIRLQAMFKTFIETTCFISTMFVLSAMAVAIVLLFNYAIYKQLHFDHFMLTYLTISLLSFLLPIFSFKWGKRIFRRFAQRGFGIGKVFTLFIAIMFPLLLLIAFLNGYIVSLAPELYEKSKCIVCGTYLNIAPVEDRFASLYWGWLLLWTPLGGSYLASISKGRTLREFVLGVMFMPFVIFVSLKLLGESDIKSAIAFINQPQFQSILSVILALLSAWFLLLIVRNARDSRLLTAGLFPISDKFKRDRIKVSNASKIVGISKFGTNLIVTMISIVMLHSVAGWYMMQFQIAGLGMFIIQAMYIVGYFFIAQFFIDKVWLGNKNIAPFKNAYVDLPKVKRKK